MPHKDMREFLQSFFNPPQLAKAKPTKKKVYKKRKKKTGPTPIQMQLDEAFEYLKFNIRKFEEFTTGEERVTHVYNEIPDEATTIDRLWPTELMNKDSRIRRELSARGRESFSCKDYDETLESYNEAVTFSSGKGLAHTLARRAGFLLQTQEHMLALRDLHLALEYGCLENELLDGLLEHHNCGNIPDLKVGRSWEKKYVSRYDPCKEKSPWIEKIRGVLDEFEKIARLTNNQSKQEKFKKLEEIIQYVKSASEELDFTKNFESKLIDVPKLQDPNYLYPSFSNSVKVVKSLEKGRHLVATRDIPVGEIIAVSDPIATLLCPEKLDKLQNHCLHCHLFSKAPIPCENCCAVVFCSIKCRDEACETYHKYECDMRLYELIPLEGKEMFGYFLALRAITQRPLQYFWDHKEMLDIFIDLDEPMNVEQDMIYNDDDYKNLMNLVTHINDMPESLSLKNSVIAVFFLRFLQHGKYFHKHVPERRDAERRLHPKEKFILKLIHHLISIQCFNSQQVTELAVVKSQYKWEVIGASLHPSLALVNHSCDANTFRFNMNQTSLLIANRHISQGEEVTMSYAVDYKTTSLSKRELHLLKLYMFQCDCRACLEKWPLKDEIPDELARIPNFEQERCFVVRHGDKKDICDEINGARWMADYGIASNTFNVAQEALDLLSVCLNKHVVKPHLHFVEACEMAELFAINQYCRMPLEIHDEDEDKLLENQCFDCEEPAEEVRIRKKAVTHSGINHSNPAEDIDGTSKLIKCFENGKETKQPDPISRREKSPTLRMFASLNEEDSGKGPRKKSVLDRIDDKFFKQNNKVENSNSYKEKSKRDLAESMRRFPKKEEMAERLSAFQPKNLVPKTIKNDSDNNNNKEKQSPDKEKAEDPRPNSSNRNSVILDLIDTIKEKVSGNKTSKTDEEISDEVSKMIELNRKKIREERKKRLEKENRHPPVLDSQYEVLETKDIECKKEISKREDKLKKMNESSDEREKKLKERELEIQKLREKTRKMLEEAQKKSEEFQSVEKTFLKGAEKVVVKKQKKGKSGHGQDSSKLMKHEGKNITADSSNSDDDKDLLAFLRQSHKKKTNIYDFMNSSKPNISEPQLPTRTTDFYPSNPNVIFDQSLASADNALHDDIKKKDSKVEVQSISPPVIKTENSNGFTKLKLKDVFNILPKKKHIEDRWEDIKKNEEINESILSTSNETNGPDPEPEFDQDQILVNGKHWAATLEESIDAIEKIANNEDDCRNRSASPEHQSPSVDEVCDTRHYSKRWSEERNTLSPSPCVDRSRSTSKSPRLRKKYNIITSDSDSQSDNEKKVPPSAIKLKPPRPGRLSRRKSLSEDCLVPKRNANSVDAFGLPRISTENKRSVSLIRDSFSRKKKEEKIDPIESEGRQRKISKETRTSNASEFKVKFESGSVSNLSRLSRASTPYKPPHLDKTHLSKVKNRFKDNNSKLPFPNFRPIPPKPTCKPPPPPPM